MHSVILNQFDFVRGVVAFLCYFLAHWCYFLFLGNQEKNVLFLWSARNAKNDWKLHHLRSKISKLYGWGPPKPPFSRGNPSFIHPLATVHQGVLYFAHCMVLRQHWLVLRKNEPWTPLICMCRVILQNKFTIYLLKDHEYNHTPRIEHHNTFISFAHFSLTWQVMESWIFYCPPLMVKFCPLLTMDHH